MARKPKTPAFDLASIVTATTGDNAGQFVYTAAAAHAEALNAGLIEVNPAMTNDAGEIATRATDKGIEAVSQTNNATPAATPAAKPSFAIDDGATLTPATRTGGGGAEKFPFSLLNVGQSFFVPVSAESPDPFKSLASTVSSASKRYATETGETRKRGEKDVPVLAYERKFEHRRRTPEQEAADGFKHGQHGARVYRVK